MDRDGPRKRGRSESPRERRERYSEDRNDYRRRDDEETTERYHDGGRRSEKPHPHRGHHRRPENEHERERERDRSPSSSSRHRHSSKNNNKNEHRNHHRRPHHNHHHHHHHHHQQQRPSSSSATTKKPPPPPPPASLPFDARPLSRTHDLEAFRPLLARYLDVQKQRDVTEMGEREVRGRWKSFARKWNGGELAEGWYSPEVFVEARGEYEEVMRERGEKGWERGREEEGEEGSGGGARYDAGDVASSGDEDEDEDEDVDGDDYGPTLPSQQPPRAAATASTATARHGPNIPTLQDLSLRAESRAEERLAAASRLALDRRADRAEQKARLEELAPPRADPGTRERRLEKKREAGEAARGFRERRTSPGAEEVGDAELMSGGGGGPGGLEEYKRALAASERKKTERELRREEIMRAKAAEREGRVRAYKEREEGVLREMREIARLRFG